jgi:UDP-glucose 4-epimerase
MSRRSVLVIGASGLVGSSLVPAFLAQGWRVTATIRSPGARSSLGDALDDASIAVVADTRDSGALQSAIDVAEPDVVINCVSRNQSGGDDAARAYTEGNVTTLAVALDACVRRGIARAIVFGSGFEYKPQARPLTERDAVGPTTLYGASKVAAYAITQFFRQTSDIDVATVRPFSLYGPRERLSRLVPYLVTSALAGRPIEMSSGTQRRDYLYVEDLADAIVRLADGPGRLPEVINFSGPADHTLLDLAIAAVETVESNVGILINRRPPNFGDRPVFLGDSSLARAVLGWQPVHDLRAGLAKTVEWYRTNSWTWELPV